jgi:hypothetical protein
MDTILP